MFSVKSAEATRILFISEAVTLAHVVRPMLLAKALIGNGNASSNSPRCEIFFASSGSFDEVVDSKSSIRESGGNSIQKLKITSQTPAAFQHTLDTGGVLFDFKRLDAYCAEELKLFDSLRPDLVVGDLRPSLAVSAVSRGIPYWNITSAYWSPYALPLPVPPPALAALRNAPLPNILKRGLVALGTLVNPLLLPRIFAQQAAGLDELRKKFGMPVFSDYLSGFTFGDKTLLADIPSLVPLTFRPPHYHFLGTLSWSPQGSLPSWWDALPLDRPLVYVSLGSSGVIELLPGIINALSKLDVTTVISTAGRISIPMTASTRVFSTDFLPGELVCQRAALVISNGGSPTTYQALSQGCPVVGIASNMDQMLSMQRTAQTGAGIFLRADTVTEKTLSGAVTAVLDQPKYRECARTLAAELSRYDAQHLFRELVRTHFWQGSKYAA